MPAKKEKKTPLTTTEVRHQPQHEEAERTVLGAVLRDNLQLDDLSGLLSPADFYHGAHKRIFEAMLNLHHKHEPIDLVTLSDQIGLNDLGSIGGVTYLSDLFDTTPAGTDPLYYARIVLEKSKRRQLIHLATELASMCFDNAHDTEELISNTERTLMDLADHQTQQPYIRLDALVSGAIKTIEMFYTSKKPVTGLPTGFHKIDEMTNGLHPKDLVIIAARPGMGKTAFALNLATNVARLSKEAVLFFSLEMGSEQLVRRVLCSRARVDSNKLQKGILSRDDWNNIIQAADELASLPLYIDDSSALTISNMFSRARRISGELKRRNQDEKLGLIIVDYLQLMTGQIRSERRDLEISAISRGLKLMAKDLEVPVIALSQLNRGVESRQDKRPMLSDLRESGAIEQDADLIMFLYRDEVYNEQTPDKNTAEVIISKQRNGPLGTDKLFFDPRFTLFDNLAIGHVPDQEEAFLA